MKTLYILTLLVLNSAISFSQNSILQGRVLFQNSGRKPAVGVRINALGANADYTTNGGNYKMLFDHKKAGNRVKLIVGKEDQYGTDIEVVNDRELENCYLPADPHDSLLIIVCPAGQRDLAAQRYYRILEPVAKRELERRREEIKRLLDQKKLDNKKIDELIQEQDVIMTQIEIAQIKIEELSTHIASINLDMASSLVQKAVRKLDEEKDVEAALAILDNEKLDVIYQAAVAKKEKANQEINQVVNGYELKISLLKSKLEYPDIVNCYNKIISIAENNQFKGEQIAYYLENLGDTYRIINNYSKSIELYQKSINLLEQKKETSAITLAMSYAGIAISYRELGNRVKTIEYQNKITNLLENSKDKHPLLGDLYNTLGLNFHILEQEDKALQSYRKAFEQVDSISDPKLLLYATICNNMALSLRTLNKIDEALKYINYSISIRERELNPMDPVMGRTYSNLAGIYYVQKKYSESIDYYKRAIKILEKSLGPANKTLATCYNNLAITYDAVNKPDQALEFYRKDLDIQLKEPIKDLSSIATVYSNMAETYETLEQIDTALVYHQRSIETWETMQKKPLRKLQATYSLYASTLQKAKRYGLAAEYQQKSVDILESTNIFNYQDSITSYHNLNVYFHDSKEYEKSLTPLLKKIRTIKNRYGLYSKELVKPFADGAIIYSKLEKYKEAILFQQFSVDILRKEQSNKDIKLGSAILIHGQYYLSQGDLDNHLKCLEEFIQIVQSIPENDQKLSNTKTLIASSFYQRGEYFSGTKKFKESIDNYSRGLEYRPNHWRLLHGRGLSYYYLRNYEMALIDYRKAATVDSAYAESDTYHNNLGMTLAKQGLFNEAQVHFEKFEKLAPSNVRVFRNWAMFFALKEEKDRAIKNLQKAIDLGYDDLEWIKTDESLASIRPLPAFEKALNSLQAKLNVHSKSK